MTRRANKIKTKIVFDKRVPKDLPSLVKIVKNMYNSHIILTQISHYQFLDIGHLKNYNLIKKKR